MAAHNMPSSENDFHSARRGRHGEAHSTQGTMSGVTEGPRIMRVFTIMAINTSAKLHRRHHMLEYIISIATADGFVA